MYNGTYQCFIVLGSYGLENSRVFSPFCAQAFFLSLFPLHASSFLLSSSPFLFLFCYIILSSEICCSSPTRFCKPSSSSRFISFCSIFSPFLLLLVFPFACNYLKSEIYLFLIIINSKKRSWWPGRPNFFLSSFSSPFPDPFSSPLFTALLFLRSKSTIFELLLFNYSLGEAGGGSLPVEALSFSRCGRRAAWTSSPLWPRLSICFLRGQNRRITPRPQRKQQKWILS